MGQWETARGRGGDEMADILGEALEKVGALVQKYTLLDLADGIEFVSRGMLVVELHQDAPPQDLSDMASDKHPALGSILDAPSIETIPNRGQMR